MELTSTPFIVAVILSISLLIMAFLYLKQKKRADKFCLRLSDYESVPEEDFYGKGKFSELGPMSAGIAHEISTPLSIIIGRTMHLQKIVKNPEKIDDLVKGLDQIHAQADRLANIITRVREYIYRNDETIEEFISLRDIIENVLVFCGQRLKNHGIELKLINVGHKYVTGHRGQFEQAILNLINNAFDAIDNLDEKWIEISAVQDADTIKVYVKDSGHGIPFEVQKKMLEPFFTTKKSKGTGLGLPLVKGIAEKHGRALKYVSNAPNTTFLLELPKARTSRYHH